MKSRTKPKQKKSPARKKPRRNAAAASGAPPQDSNGEGRPPIGLEASVERLVPYEWTIQAIDPRLPAVLSTPAMIGVMEHATANAVREALPPGAITVGTRIEVDHLKAVPDGATILAHARLVRYEGRFLVFEVEARAGEHVIGRGRVFRAIVHPDVHGAKAKSRVEP
jgi:fluoroacetyl-CoA thioesterase